MSDANKTQALTADPNRTQLGAPPAVDPNKTLLGAAPTLNATVTIKPVQCTICKTFNPPGVMFCIECGLIFDKALPGDAFGAPAVQLPVLVDEGGREHPIRPGATTVGREGDILIADGRVSRRHAQITSVDGRLLVEDLGSTNGTKVNDEPLTSERELAAGDTVSLGGLTLKLTMPGQATATVMPISNKTAAMESPPTLAKPAAYLVGELGELPLKRGGNTFGRKADNDVQIAEPYVSGRHGLIEVDEDGVYLSDTGSTNGTVLNDSKLPANQRTQITPDDIIRLGSLTFKVRMEEK